MIINTLILVVALFLSTIGLMSWIQAWIQVFINKKDQNVNISLMASFA